MWWDSRGVGGEQWWHQIATVLESDPKKMTLGNKMAVIALISLDNRPENKGNKIFSNSLF